MSIIGRCPGTGFPVCTRTCDCQSKLKPVLLVLQGRQGVPTVRPGAVALQDQRQQHSRHVVAAVDGGSTSPKNPTRFAGTDCSPHTRNTPLNQLHATDTGCLLQATCLAAASMFMNSKVLWAHTLTASGPTPPHCVRHASPAHPGTHRLRRSGSTEPSCAVVVKGGQDSQVAFVSCDHLIGLKVPAGCKRQHTQV